MEIPFSPAFPGESIYEYADALVAYWDRLAPTIRQGAYVTAVFRGIALVYTGVGGAATLVQAYHTGRTARTKETACGTSIP